MTYSGWTSCIVFVLIIVSAAPAAVRAQDESALAKTSRNPIADLISVRLPNNMNFDSTKDDVWDIANIPPVIPFRLTDDWNLIVRTTVPLIDQLELTPSVGEVFGPVPSPLTTALRLRGERIQTDDVDGAGLRHESGSVVRLAADEPAEVEHNDPWERFNGKTFEFNRRMDQYALKPVAKVWKTVVPGQAQIMIANAFDNLNVVPRVINNLLQRNWDGAGRELNRFLLNSTAGVGGLFDPATDSHIRKSPADFGQTLGKWGIEPGPYLVLPFMEPLSVRDGIGYVVDRAINPLSYVVPLIPALSLTAGKRINERALSYELFADFDSSVIDEYTAVRDSYLQRRKRLLNE